MVIGSEDSSGNIEATNIYIRTQGQDISGGGGPGMGFPGNPGQDGSGNTPSPSDGQTPPDNGSQPGPANGIGRMPGVFGTLDSISGNILTLTDTQGEQVKVTVTAETMIYKTVTGSIEDLQAGIDVMVRGETDESGNVTAASIMISNKVPADPPESVARQ